MVSIPYSGKILGQREFCLVLGSIGCELYENKLATEAEMYNLSWGLKGEAWKCCRRLVAWE